MANHVININPLSPMSIMLAERRFRRITSDFDRKVDEFIAEVAEIGRETAEAMYGGAPVSVSVEAIDNGYAVVAEGETLAIIEFGAGDATNGSNPFASQSPYEIRPGSYSEQNYNAITNRPRPSYHIDGQWRFGGVTYTEIQPHNAMQGAWAEVQARWREIAERVFA